MLCNPQESCLVVVDMQEKLGRAMPSRIYERISTSIGLLLQAAVLLEVPCIASLQYPRGLGDMDTKLKALLPDNAPVVEKTRFSCVGVEEFDKALAATGRRQVCLVGMEAHICILQTALDLQAAGCSALVVEDAVCSRKRENCKNAIRRLSTAGISMPHTESLLYEWLRDAKHERFKELSLQCRARLHGDEVQA